jgi:CBS domain-containing protein
MRVRDVMTTTVTSVTPDRPLREVAELLTQRKVSGLPVVGRDGWVLGVVSEADFLAHDPQPPARAGILARLRRRGEPQTKAAARTAGEAMTSPAITIDPDASVRQAADTMVRRKVNRLPVIEEGRLVGIVTRADIVRVFTRSDADLAAAVGAEISARTSVGPEPGVLDVDVRDGVVRLSGTVERRSLAETIVAVARDVGGVLRVDDHLTWVEDDLRHHTIDPDRGTYLDAGGPTP